MRSMSALALLLSLGACSFTGSWHKAGTSPEAAAADYAECRHSAEIADRRDRDIDTDILATRGPDWERLGLLSIKQNDYANSNNAREGNSVSRCMIDKGYTGG